MKTIDMKRKIADPLQHCEGDTTISHCSQRSTMSVDFLPCDDDSTDGDIDIEDDDGFGVLSWALPRGRNSRAKKQQPRKWYDEDRLRPENNCD